MSLFRGLRSLAAVFGEGDNVVRDAIQNQKTLRTAVGVGAFAIGAGAVMGGIGAVSSGGEGITAAGVGTAALGAASIAGGYLTAGRRLGQGLRLLDREASNMRRAVMGQTGDVTEAVGRVNARLQEFAQANDGRQMSEFRRRSLAARAGFGTGNQRVYFGTAGERRVGLFDEGAAPREFSEQTGQYTEAGFLRPEANGTFTLRDEVTPQERLLLSRSRTAPIGREQDPGINLTSRVELGEDLNQANRDFNQANQRGRYGTPREQADQRRAEAERLMREELNYGNSPEEVANFDQAGRDIIGEDGTITPRRPVGQAVNEDGTPGADIFIDPNSQVGYAEFVTDDQGRNIGVRTNQHFDNRERELTGRIEELQGQVGPGQTSPELDAAREEYRTLASRRDFINNYREGLPGQGTIEYPPDERPNGVPDIEFPFLGNENETVGVGGTGRFPEQRRLGTAMDEVLGGASRGGPANRATYLDEGGGGDAHFNDLLERERRNVRETYQNRATRLEEEATSPNSTMTNEEYNNAMDELQNELNQTNEGIFDRVYEQHTNRMSRVGVSQQTGGGGFLMHAFDFVAIPGITGTLNAAKEGMFYNENENESPFIGRLKSAAEGFKSGASSAFLGVAGIKGVQGAGRLSLLNSNPNLFNETGGFFGSPSLMQSIDRGALAVMGGGRAQHPAFGDIPGRMNQAVREGSVSSNLGMLRDERAAIEGIERRITGLEERINNGGLTAEQGRAAGLELEGLRERRDSLQYSFNYNSERQLNPGVHSAYASMDEFGGYDGEFGLALSDFPTIAATYAGGLVGGAVRSIEMGVNSYERNRINNRSGFLDRFRRTNTDRLEMSARDADVLGIPEREFDLIGSGGTLGIFAAGGGAAVTLGAAASSYGGGMGHPINALTNNYDLQASAEAQMQADASERIRMMNSSMIGINDISENYYVNPSLSPTRGKHRPGKYNDDGSLVFALSNLRRG
jgi:hypothetical protein